MKFKKLPLKLFLSFIISGFATFAFGQCPLGYTSVRPAAVAKNDSVKQHPILPAAGLKGNPVDSCGDECAAVNSVNEKNKNNTALAKKKPDEK